MKPVGHKFQETFEVFSRLHPNKKTIRGWSFIFSL